MNRCEKPPGTRAKVHSLESFGTLDGPGIRYVVFLQGCPGRCLYCQNPDTWDTNAGSPMSADEIFGKIERCVPYIRSSGGGVTVSGGEPLLQAPFVADLFRRCKASGIHTALDTSAFLLPGTDGRAVDDAVGLSDLIILDIKAATRPLHRKITSRGLDEVLSFLGLLKERGKPYWLRYVLVPGLNDALHELRALRKIVEPLTHCEQFEFLPYHTLGAHKWKHLGIRYPLAGVRCATAEDVERAKRVVRGVVRGG